MYDNDKMGKLSTNSCALITCALCPTDGSAHDEILEFFDRLCVSTLVVLPNLIVLQSLDRIR